MVVGRSDVCWWLVTWVGVIDFIGCLGSWMGGNCWVEMCDCGL